MKTMENSARLRKVISCISHSSGLTLTPSLENCTLSKTSKKRDIYFKLFVVENWPNYGRYSSKRHVQCEK